MTVGGRHPDCIEEKKALVRSKQQLEMAQEKLKLCRQWSIKAHRAADEYQSRLGRAEQAVVQGIPRMMAILERIVLALEQYTATERPSRSDPLVFDTTTASPVKPERGSGTDRAAPSGRTGRRTDRARKIGAAVKSLADDLTEVTVKVAQFSTPVAKLQGAMDNLQRAWLEANQHWEDATSDNLQRAHLEPLLEGAQGDHRVDGARSAEGMTQASRVCGPQSQQHEF